MLQNEGGEMNVTERWLLIKVHMRLNLSHLRPKTWVSSVTLWLISPLCSCSKNKNTCPAQAREKDWRWGRREMREGVWRKVGEEWQYSLGNRLWRRNWEVFWLVLHSGRVQCLPEGGYKKTKEAGGHVESLLKGRKHPLHNPTTATITTTGEEKEMHSDRINGSRITNTNRKTHTLKARTSSITSSNIIGPSGQLVWHQVFRTALHQAHKTDSHNKQLRHPPMNSVDWVF